LDYAQEENICRSQILLGYFGEKNTKPCGKCDVCLKKKENELNDEDFEIIKTQILSLLKSEPQTINSLVKQLRFKETKTIKVVRFLIDNGHLSETIN